MISYYKTLEGKITPIAEYEPGCWINVIDPTEDEILGLIDDHDLVTDFISAALDEEESSRIESEDGTCLLYTSSIRILKLEKILMLSVQRPISWMPV